jgi:hypothetical protein
MSTILRTASSSVVPLKAGGFLEVRRGDLRGAKLAEKRTWASQEEWLAAIGEPLLETPSSASSLTADQLFVNTHGGRVVGRMTKYNPKQDIHAISWISKYPPVYAARLEQLTKLVESATTANYYVVAGKTRLYVLNEDNVMYPIYIQRRLGLLGVPEGTHRTWRGKTVLKTGRTFEELGISPKSYWRKGENECMNMIERTE